MADKETYLYIPDVWGEHEDFYGAIVSWSLDGLNMKSNVLASSISRGRTLTVVRQMDEYSSNLAQIFTIRGNKFPRVSVITDVRSATNAQSRAVYFFFDATPLSYIPTTTNSGDREEVLQFDFDRMSNYVKSGGVVRYSDIYK